METWNIVLQTLVGLAVLGLAWSVFSRFAAGSSADEATYLWAGAVIVAVIAGIMVISLLFSWLQQRTSRHQELRLRNPPLQFVGKQT